MKKSLARLHQIRTQQGFELSKAPKIKSQIRFNKERIQQDSNKLEPDKVLSPLRL
jgi:hypothetical protein